MQEKLEDLLRDELSIGFYPDELTPDNDGHNIFVSVEALVNLNPNELEKLINILKENKWEKLQNYF